MGISIKCPLTKNCIKSIFGAGLAPTIGYSDLKPEKQFFMSLASAANRAITAIEMSAFYKDIRDLLAVQSIRYESEKYGPSNYSIYMNKDYGNVKGYTFSLTKDMIQFQKHRFCDYTYQVTEGNNVTSGSFYYNALSSEQEEKRIVPLAWDQRHILNTNVSVGIEKLESWYY